MAHTPGPWTVIRLPSGEYRIDAKSGPLLVCPAIAHGLEDARLIAAAPALLEALEAAEEILEFYAERATASWNKHATLAVTLDLVRAAITRATGDA